MTGAPIIVVNFKAYEEICGEKGLALAAACGTVSSETGVSIIPGPQMVDLARTASSAGVPVWSQSVDGVAPGGRTGHTTAHALKGAGAVGTLLNHSERRMLAADIDAAVTACKNVGLVTCVCTNNTPVSCAMAALGPDYVAIEPPELIGGDVSVTSADPEIVSRTVDQVLDVNKKVQVLCGAGVKTGRDVAAAIELGARGVLLASGVVKADDPTSVLRDMAGAL
jgi:triosephosphate isomerase